ncbi:MAG: hypothetical protein LKJ25_03220 [Clostridia bacterium]|jgi:hypothetical protein|nr:hypothetical protein [Clostridia bacterium]
MAIVRDFYDGSTHIMIDDSCCVHTKEEVNEILERIRDNAQRSITAAEIKKEQSSS